MILNLKLTTNNTATAAVIKRSNPEMAGPAHVWAELLEDGTVRAAFDDPRLITRETADRLVYPYAVGVNEVLDMFSENVGTSYVADIDSTGDPVLRVRGFY